MALYNGLAGNRRHQVAPSKKVVVPAGHWMVVLGKILAGILLGKSWMVDSLSKLL